MQDTIVSFETAKLAKQKGFPQQDTGEIITRLNYYNHKGELNGSCEDHLKHRKTPNSEYDLIRAPTQSLLAKWLLQEHFIHVIVNTEFVSFWAEIKRPVHHTICVDKNNGNLIGWHDEALEIALKEALNLI